MLWLFSCAHQPAPLPTQVECGLIVTDDDIPSGSGTAGALYVEDAKLGRDLLTADVVAVAQGFFDGGLSCVHVVDSHDGAIDSKPLERLGVSVLTPSNTEWTWPFIGPMQGTYRVAALVGFHSAGHQPDGFRPHTINDNIAILRINGEAQGEVAHAILGIGAFGVPMGLVTGDENATAEAVASSPETATVKMRWHAIDGSVEFLAADAAHAELRSKSAQAASSPPQVVLPSLPMNIEVATRSAERMAGQYPEMAEKYHESIDGEAVFAARLDVDLMQHAVQTDDRTLAWATADPFDAFFSIGFAAWYLGRSGDNWDLVTQGYKAFKTGRYEEAIAAYQEALNADPYDVATRCRMGGAYLENGDPDTAKRSFQFGVDRLDEMDATMGRWCCSDLVLLEVSQNRCDEARSVNAACKAAEIHVEDKLGSCAE